MGTSKITVYTQCYNAEKYMRKAIESVLSQTLSDFEYVLVDNGSADSSRRIMEEYAAKDRRIKLLRYDENVRTLCRPGFDHKLFTGEYFIVLDPDDWYEPDAFEKLYGFAESNRLDMAMCGISIFSANGARGDRRVAQDTVFGRGDISANIGGLYQFFRTWWAKLYKARLLAEFDRSDFTHFADKGVLYASDTVLCLDLVRSAERIGILKDTLHHYFVYPQATSYRYDPDRLFSDTFLYDKALRFCGELGGASGSVRPFLRAVYFQALIDSIDMLIKSETDVSSKLSGLVRTLRHPLSRSTIAEFSTGMDRYVSVCEGLLSFLLKAPRRGDPESTERVAEILPLAFPSLSALVDGVALKWVYTEIPGAVSPLAFGKYADALKRAEAWGKAHRKDASPLSHLEYRLFLKLGKETHDIFSFLADVKENRPQSAGEMDADGKIMAITAQYPLLAGLSLGLALALKETVIRTMKNDIPGALDSYITASTDLEIADSDADGYFALGINLSAAAENANAYVYFKKVWLSYLLDHGRDKEAKPELDEMLELLPGDEELAALFCRWDLQ